MSDRSLLEDAATRLFADHCRPEAVIAAEDGFLAPLWDAIEELGFHLLAVDEDAGGFGGTLADAVTLAGVAGGQAAPVPLAEALLASWALAAAGVALPDGPTTIHVRPPGGDPAGPMEAVPYGRVAASVVQVAGRAVRVVRPDPARVDAGHNLAGEPRDRIRIEPGDVVAAGELPEHELWALAGLLRSAQIAGALDRILRMTVTYVGQRRQFGRGLGGFQAVQQAVARQAGITGSVAAAVAAAASGQPFAIAAANAYVRRHCGTAVAIAHQLHGAIGLTLEFELQLHTRRVWAWRDEFGTQQEWARDVGRRAGAAGADALWPLVAAR